MMSHLRSRHLSLASSSLLEATSEVKAAPKRRLHPLDYHPERSLHKASSHRSCKCPRQELFEPSNCRRWAHPELLKVLSEGKRVDLEKLQGFKVEAPGIFSFPALTDEFCELLLKALGGL